MQRLIGMSHFKASIYNYYFIYLNEYYVYNTRSGCLGKLTKDEYRFLTQEEFQELYSIEALDSFYTRLQI